MYYCNVYQLTMILVLLTFVTGQHEWCCPSPSTIKCNLCVWPGCLKIQFFCNVSRFSFSSQIISRVFICFENFRFLAKLLGLFSFIFAKKFMKMGPRTKQLFNFEVQNRYKIYKIVEASCMFTPAFVCGSSIFATCK